MTASNGPTNRYPAPERCPRSNLAPMEAMKESAEAKQNALGAARMNTNTMIIQNIPAMVQQ
jgi:hypothetical protein